MGMNLPILQAQLFGKEKIIYGDTYILNGKNMITKAMKLLLILLYYGKQGIERGRLIENLYGNEEIADVANNLRVTMHRLKKILEKVGIPEIDFEIMANKACGGKAINGFKVLKPEDVLNIFKMCK